MLEGVRLMSAVRCRERCVGDLNWLDGFASAISQSCETDAWLRLFATEMAKQMLRNSCHPSVSFKLFLWCFVSWNSGSWTLISKQNFPVDWVTPGGFSNNSRADATFSVSTQKTRARHMTQMHLQVIPKVGWELCLQYPTNAVCQYASFQQEPRILEASNRPSTTSLILRYHQVCLICACPFFGKSMFGDMFFGFLWRFYFHEVPTGIPFGIPETRWRQAPAIKWWQAPKCDTCFFQKTLTLHGQTFRKIQSIFKRFVSYRSCWDFQDGKDGRQVKLDIFLFLNVSGWSIGTASTSNRALSCKICQPIWRLAGRDWWSDIFGCFWPRQLQLFAVHTYFYSI